MTGTARPGPRCLPAAGRVAAQGGRAGDGRFGQAGPGGPGVPISVLILDQAPGIEMSADAVLRAREAAYAVSLSRRANH